jgi:hypothetical protein
VCRLSSSQDTVSKAHGLTAGTLVVHCMYPDRPRSPSLTALTPMLPRRREDEAVGHFRRIRRIRGPSKAGLLVSLVGASAAGSAL